MAEYSPPFPNIIIPFDSLYYDVNSNASITLAYANATYYKKSGGIVNGFILATESITTQNNLVVPLGKFTIGSTLVTSSALQLNYNNISVIGIAEASKALILDSSRNISNINIINGEQMKLTTFLNNTIAINSFSNTQVNNSSVIGDFDFYIKKNTAQVGDTCSIGFTATANDINTTTPMAAIIANRVSFQVGTLSFNTTQVERLKISETGIISLSNTTDSSSSTVGALTIAGGLAIAKKLYIGTDLSVAGNSTLTTLSLTDITLNGNLTMNNISSNLTVSGTNSSINLTGGSSILTLSNTSPSTSALTGAIRCSGGIYLGGNSYINANLNIMGDLNIGNLLTVPLINARLTVNQANDAGGSYETSANSIQINSQVDGTFSTTSLYMGASAIFNNGWISASKAGSYSGLLLNPKGGKVIINSTSQSFTQEFICNTTSLLIGASQMNDRLFIQSTSKAYNSKEYDPNSFMIRSGSSDANVSLYMNCDNTLSGSDGSGNNPRMRASIQASHVISDVRLLDNLCLNPLGGTVVIGTTSSYPITDNALQVSGRIYTNAGIIAGGTLYIGSSLPANFEQTASIFCNGGIYIEKNLIVITDLSIGGNSTLTGTLGVTGATTLSSTLGVTGTINFDNVTDATSSTAGGCLTISGGAAVAKKLFVGTDLSIGGNSTLTGTLNVLGTSTFASATFTDLTITNDIACRRITLNAENNHILFNKPSDANAYSRASYNGGSYGDYSLFIQKTASNWSGVLSVGLRGVLSNEGGRVSVLSTLRGTSTLDLGVGFRANILILQQTSSGHATNQIGVNSTALTLTSAQSGGFTFHSNTTATPELEGNLLATINTIGEIRSQSNIFSNAGIHTNGISQTSQVQVLGDSGHLHYGGSKFSVFGYNYQPLLAQPWRNLSLGNDRIFIKDGDGIGLIGIGTVNPNFPLHITRYISTSFTGYGYLISNSTSSGYSSGSSGSVNVGLKVNDRVIASEFDALSDRRLKENIENIKLDKALLFIKNINPKKFNWKDSKSIDYGYIAQDILKLESHSFDDIVSVHQHENLEEEIDDDGFISPQNMNFSVNYNEITPILHTVIKDLLKQVEISNELIKKNIIEIEKLKNLLNEQDERIDEIIDVINEDYSD